MTWVIIPVQNSIHRFTAVIDKLVGALEYSLINFINIEDLALRWTLNIVIGGNNVKTSSNPA